MEKREHTLRTLGHRAKESEGALDADFLLWYKWTDYVWKVYGSGTMMASKSVF